MLKPILKAFLLLAAFLLAPALSANAQSFIFDGIEYTVLDADAHTCELTDGQSASGTLVIPSKVKIDFQEYTVVSIGERAFFGCINLASVVIPNSVTSVGWRAFSGCSSLTSVEIPDSVTSIGDWAFSGCSSLTSVVIPNSVTSIGWRTFSGCSRLTSVEIPNSVTSIGNYAFYGCNLTSVEIPNSVTSIGEWAFSGCSSLTSVEIPASVTSIGNYAFEGCNNLEIVSYLASDPIVGDVNIFTNKAYQHAMLYVSQQAYEKAKTIDPWKNFAKIEIGFSDIVYRIIDAENFLCEVSDGRKDNGDVVIPSNVIIKFQKYTVVSIGERAFEWCEKLTSVEIPTTVTSISKHAFYQCRSLTSVKIPNSVTSIGERAFGDCWSLTFVEIPNSVTYISKDAFFGSGLTSVEIPDSVTAIGETAFSWCTSLTSVKIPISVTSIGEQAFSLCKSLTFVEISASVTYIGYNAFDWCGNIETVSYLAPDPVEGDKSIFSDETYQNATLYVSQEGYNKARTIDPWRNFSNIEVRDTEGIADAVADDADTELYDLNGRRVDNPSSGIYIRRRGTVTEKVIIR